VGRAEHVLLRHVDVDLPIVLCMALAFGGGDVIIETMGEKEEGRGKETCFECELDRYVVL
jgi:hypothetical protein